MRERLSVLIVDDDDVDRTAVRRTLRQAGFDADVVEAATVASAVQSLNERAFDCIFLDFNLPDGTGLEVLRRLNLAHHRAPVIVLTGQGDEETAVQLMKAGASDYIVKNAATVDRLKSTIPNVLRLFQAEQGLREAEERLRLAVDAGAIGTWDYNLLNGTLTWSDRAKQCFGLPSAAQVDYDLFMSLVHPQDRASVEKEIKAATTPGGSGELKVEYRIVSPDGSVRWIRGTGRAFFRGSNGATRAVRLIGTVSDVTTEREREVALRRYAQQLRGLAEASLVINSAMSLSETAQVITDQSRRIIGAHQALSIIRIGKNWDDKVQAVSVSEKYDGDGGYQPPPNGGGIEELVFNSNRPVRMTQAELEKHPGWQSLPRFGNDKLPMRGLVAAPLVARDGTNLGLIQLSDRYEGEFTAEDEAVLVQLAQLASVAIENVRLFEKVQEAVRTREDVLAIVSHDLRNPLNTILGSAALMTDIPLTPEQQKKQLEIIKRTGLQMNRLLQDLLDVARIEAGGLAVEPMVVDTSSVLNDVSVIFEHLVKSHGQTLLCEFPPDLPPVKGDRERLVQVFSNLITNSVRFTPSGGHIRLSVNQNGGYLEFVVADTGTGIKREDLPYVFERFWQARRARRTGAGLGLAIVKGIVEAHGGSIRVDAEEGRGTAFYFTIPVALKTELTSAEE